MTAFTSSDSKQEDALKLGAHQVVNSRNPTAIQAMAGSLNFILSTVNAPLDWEAFMATLAPHGKLHFVGTVMETIPASVFDLQVGEKTMGGSMPGSPQTIATMLDFAARHHIEAVTERFSMSRVNDAFERLRSGQARYRVVLENDWH